MEMLLSGKIIWSVLCIGAGYLAALWDFRRAARKGELFIDAAGRLYTKEDAGRQFHILPPDHY